MFKESASGSSHSDGVFFCLAANLQCPTALNCSVGDYMELLSAPVLWLRHLLLLLLFIVLLDQLMSKSESSNWLKCFDKFVNQWQWLLLRIVYHWLSIVLPCVTECSGQYQFKLALNCLLLSSKKVTGSIRSQDIQNHRPLLNQESHINANST